MFILLLWVQFLLSQTFTEQARINLSGKEPGRLSNPRAIDITQNGIILIVDTGNNRIQLFDLHGQFKKAIGGFGFQEDQFDHPTDIWARQVINYYVSDYNNQRLIRYDHNFNFISAFVSRDTWDTDYQFTEVISCAVNSQNDLFILDRGENKIVKFNRHDQPERSFGSYESGAGDLQEPHQLEMVAGKYLAVSDAGRKSVLIFDYFGTFIKELTHKRLQLPTGLATDREQGLYVADPQAQMIFHLGNRLDRLQPVNYLGGKLQHPVDLSLWQNGNRKIAYILDGDQLVIAGLSLP